ncbi:hypothetical protein [Gimesia aquarii]|uniref:Flagellar basal body P-ring protein n=1 Tax=Gimesia aquarii TaxID=2527964 RepID=A0A517W239_9PLAN|nr:hypothetical protein [Gimesia aquarii]QDT99311.1 hypothetical protein V144x_48220 [Gimesia aquarii]
MRIILVIMFCLSILQTSRASEKIETLIDKLVTVSEPGFGYLVYSSGTEFLPYADTGMMGAQVIGAGQPVRSEPLRKIVEQGIDAIPTLIKHIGDERKINMKPVQGFSFTGFIDLYDFNNRTRKDVPSNVNLDLFEKDENHPNKHSITVGDLCFVALGQIVNRRFAATKYVPTGILAVSSPSYSKQLREVVIKDWQDLTREQHIQQLIQDFKMPDHEGRQFGAYLRLSFYYPEFVETLVLKQLNKPVYDADKISNFVSDKLYEAGNKEQQQKLFDEFIRINGETYAGGIMESLYYDLKYLEEVGQDDLEFRSSGFKTHPRELLVQLFDQPANIKFADRPYMSSMPVSERISFIRSLRYDKSKKVGEVLQRIYLADSEEAEIAPACLLALANRGYAEFLIDQLRRIDFTNTKHNEFYWECLASISTSKDRLVQDKLLEIAEMTTNPGYFLKALDGVKKPYSQSIFKQAKHILELSSETSYYEEGILEMIGEQFPDRAKVVYQNYLATGSVDRAKTMCNVLWYGSSLSKEILGPLLDDRRNLTGFESSMRVCDRAATAISHTTDKIKFDSDWSLERKDMVIIQLKKYCVTPDQ